MVRRLISEPLPAVCTGYLHPIASALHDFQALSCASRFVMCFACWATLLELAQSPGSMEVASYGATAVVT